jgi:SNF2 family DNA or RNA helicase
MIINEVVDMKQDQMNFYQDVVKGIAETDRVDLSTTNLLGMCTRLRQASSCPSILTSEDISAAKLDRAEDLVEEIIEQGESVVIFSGFKESCYTLGKRLEKYKPYVLTGDTKQDIIDKAISDFQKSKEPQIIIGTWQKLGTGITLTKASYMLFIDTPWTSAEFEQSCDRIYRIGTSKSVTIYNLICKDTIDERVRDILDTKEALSDYLVDDAIKTQGAFDILSKYIMEL